MELIIKFMDLIITYFAPKKKTQKLLIILTSIIQESHNYVIYYT